MFSDLDSPLEELNTILCNKPGWASGYIDLLEYKHVFRDPYKLQGIISMLFHNETKRGLAENEIQLSYNLCLPLGAKCTSCFRGNPHYE